MEWYRIIIVVVGAVGMLVAIINWYFNGVDVPNGLVTLLSLIISATLGPDAFNKIKAGINKAQEKKAEEEKTNTEDKKEEE